MFNIKSDSPEKQQFANGFLFHVAEEQQSFGF
jgi:hypothetical protein